MRVDSRVVGCMLTHAKAFPEAIKTLDYYRAFDLMLVMLPEKDESEFERCIEAALQTGHVFPPYRIVAHAIELRGGKPQHGLLRDRQQYYLQDELHRVDIGVLLDDDLMVKASVIIDPDVLKQYNAEEKRRKALLEKHPCNRSERAKLLERRGLVRVYSRPLTPTDLIVRLRALAFAARERRMPFFTFAATSSPHGGRGASAGEYRPVATWSGFLGMFKDSPRYFNPKMMTCEDWDAAGAAICAREGFAVLGDPCTVQQMGIDCKKYGERGCLNQDRLAAMKKIQSRYRINGEPVFVSNYNNQMGECSKIKVPTLQLNRKVREYLHTHEAH